MIIEVGIQKSKIITDNPKILASLSNLYSFKVQGAEFTPAYRSRRWDGKKRFITKGGSFRSGLLHTILEDLRAIDCIPKLNYKYNLEQVDLKYFDNFTYYEYQEEALKTALQQTRGIIQAPTGAGKTLIIAGLVKSLSPRKTVILFNAKTLLKQTYDFLVNDCGLENVGLCFGEGYLYGNIMLCTIQSIEKIIETHLDDAEVLIVDEVHEFSKGELTVPAIESFPKATFRYGLTATVPTDPIPNLTVKGAFGPIISCRTTKGLVKEGYLTEPIIQILPVKKKEVDDGLSYAALYEDLIINNQDRNDSIKTLVEAIRNANDKPRILILVKNLEHGQILQRKINRDCFYLKGDDSISNRYSVINKFLSCKNGSVLIGTKILQTGVNIREITHFINARGLKSPIATIQALGRSLRKHESKEVVFVYDFLDKGKYLEKHAKKRIATYRKEGHRVTIL